MKAFAPALALTLLAAIAATAPAQEWEGALDTEDGVEVVLNPAVGMLPPLTLDLDEVWRLGGESEADEEFFGVIGDIIIDDANTVYILDSQLSEVRIFDESGSYLRTMGREGEGPGEFRRPSDLVFLPNGSLGVLQPWPSKLIVFNEDGSPGDDFPFEPTGGEGWAGITAVKSAGDNLALVYRFSEPGDASFKQETNLAIVSDEGVEVAKLTTSESTMDYASSKVVEVEWNGFEWCWVSGSSGDVFARESFTDYAIHNWGADGALKRIIRRDYPAHERTSEDIEELKANWNRMIKRWVPDAKFDIEPSWNPIQDLHAREDGTLWVRTSRGARDLADGVMAQFDVFDEDGKFLQEVTLNGEFDPDSDGIFFSRNHIFVVTDLIAARQAMRGGADEDAELEAEDPEPMAVICYRVDYGYTAQKN